MAQHKRKGRTAKVERVQMVAQRKAVQIYIWQPQKPFRKYGDIYPGRVVAVADVERS